MAVGHLCMPGCAVHRKLLAAPFLAGLCRTGLGSSNGQEGDKLISSAWVSTYS